MRETRVRSLGREDPLEKEMVTHSSILAWRIPWTEEPVYGATVHRVTKSRTRLSDFTSLHHSAWYSKNLRFPFPLSLGCPYCSPCHSSGWCAGRMWHLINLLSNSASVSILGGFNEHIRRPVLGTHYYTTPEAFSTPVATPCTF